MNIGIFTDTYSPEINGVVTSIRQLEDELTKHGHHVYIITSSSYRKIVRINNVIHMPGINIKKLYGYNVSGFYSVFGAKYISDLKLDIIHAQTEYGIGIFARIMAMQFNIPLVYTYHTMMEDYTHYLSKYLTRYSTRPLKSFMKSASRVYANRCTQLIVPSNKTAEAMVDYGVTNHINIIPTGIDLTKFRNDQINNTTINALKEKYDIDSNTFCFIYVGRLAQEKSVDEIIEAFKILREQHLKHFKFIIIGDGPSFEELKALVASYKLSKEIIFLGKIKNDLIPLYYHLGHCFISTSTTETQGLTFIEAMASGLPVICSYDKNLADLIINGENGYVINNVNDLALMMGKMMKLDHDSYQNLKKHAQASIIKYSSSIFYDKVMAVYHKAIEENKTNDKSFKNIRRIRSLSSFFRE
ncbi:MAG: glycosyltransferase [Bacilli bacterium]|jgi:1,2-diacylglycerol 3-alpha-glucosyltransferase|nr:glycosyltransferase [Bacilli bacterium]